MSYPKDLSCVPVLVDVVSDDINSNQNHVVLLDDDLQDIKLGELDFSFEHIPLVDQNKNEQVYTEEGVTCLVTQDGWTDQEKQRVVSEGDEARRLDFLEFYFSPEWVFPQKEDVSEQILTSKTSSFVCETPLVVPLRDGVGTGDHVHGVLAGVDMKHPKKLDAPLERVVDVESQKIDQGSCVSTSRKISNSDGLSADSDLQVFDTWLTLMLADVSWSAWQKETLETIQKCLPWYSSSDATSALYLIATAEVLPLLGDDLEFGIDDVETSWVLRRRTDGLLYRAHQLCVPLIKSAPDVQQRDYFDCLQKIFKKMAKYQDPSQ